MFCRKIGHVVNEAFLVLYLKWKFEPVLPWMIQWMSHHEEDSQWIAFECPNVLLFNWLCGQIFGCFSFENNEMLLLQWLHLLSSSSEIFFEKTFLLCISSNGHSLSVFCLSSSNLISASFHVKKI